MIEVKNVIFKSFYHFIRFGGLLIMPLIYAFSYIFAFYDPFEKVDQLPIALYVAKNNGKNNLFGEALKRHLSKKNEIEIGELHMSLKMMPEDIYVDNMSDKELVKTLEEKSKDKFAAIYLPNFGDDIVFKDGSKPIPGMDQTIINAINKFKNGNPLQIISDVFYMVGQLSQKQIDEVHKIQVYNNKKKNYLLGFGVGIGKDMAGTSQFLLKTFIETLKDQNYLDAILNKTNLLNQSEKTAFKNKIIKLLNSVTIYNQPKLRLISQMGGEHAKYGYGLAPFFISVSMWIGGMVMTFAVHRKIFNFDITAGKRYLAKWILIMLGIFVQSSLVMGSLYFIGFDKLGIEHWGAMYGFTIIIALIFAAIIQGIRYSIHERSLGLFIIIIILVLQMASAGGLFPVDTQSGFYKVMNKILPMSKAINIIREVSFETNWSRVMNQLGYLMLYLLIVPFAVLINQVRTIHIYFEQGKELPRAMKTPLASWVWGRYILKQSKGGKHV